MSYNKTIGAIFFGLASGLVNPRKNASNVDYQMKFHIVGYIFINIG